MKQQIIAVDFDGTLCRSNYPFIGEANIEVIKHVKERKQSGDILILWTCRTGERLEEALRWCKSNGLIFDYCNENTKDKILKYGGDCRKVYADIYLDDRAINANEF